jgi:hypothetical protein
MDRRATTADTYERGTKKEELRKLNKYTTKHLKKLAYIDKQRETQQLIYADKIQTKQMKKQDFLGRNKINP